MISLFEGHAKYIMLNPRKPGIRSKPKKHYSNKAARNKNRTKSPYDNDQK